MCGRVLGLDRSVQLGSIVLSVHTLLKPYENCPIYPLFSSPVSIIFYHVPYFFSFLVLFFSLLRCIHSQLTFPYPHLIGRFHPFPRHPLILSFVHMITYMSVCLLCWLSRMHLYSLYITSILFFTFFLTTNKSVSSKFLH